MDQQLWMREVFREVWAGRTCAGDNGEELTKYKKDWRQEGGGKGGKGCNNGGSMGLWPLTRQPLVGQQSPNR